MARAGSTVLPMAFLALALVGVLWLPSCFVPAVDRRALLAAAAAAAAAGQQEAAEAAQARFSLFGFDAGGGAVSDAYQQIDPDAVSPYSQFGNPNDADFVKDNALREKLLEKNKARVVDYVKELDQIPNFIQTKNAEKVKQVLTLKAYQLRESMEYVTMKNAPQWGAKLDTPGMKEAREFFQDLADLGVGAGLRNWPMATESYDKSKGSFKAWLNVVGL